MTTTIEVKDHNSKIMYMIPSHLQEPITLIAKIKGFESVDDYVIQLVKDELESMRWNPHLMDEFLK